MLHEMEPLVPALDHLRDRAGEVVLRAGELGRHLHPVALDAVAELLRTINCYYTNLIEGHDTHPIDIERALQCDYASNPRLRDLQIEAGAHIRVQRLIEERLVAEPGLNVCAPGFLRCVHREFYKELPAALRVVRHSTGDREEVIEPGELRSFGVRVGRHVAPPPAALDGLLARFASVYDPASRSADPQRALVLLGAAHHRLLWIHPFGDGNGRVTRLMTDAYLRRIGLGGHGLWTVSRGLARARTRYREALANADQPRWNDYDGRGPLSARGLAEFCAFFLDVCADQITYMGGLLAIDQVLHNLTAYCGLRAAGLVRGASKAEAAEATPARRGRRPLLWRPEATRLLRVAVTQGPIPRGEVPGLLNVPERTARRVVAELVAEGFLASTSHRAPLVIRFPAHAAPYVFPGLYAPRGAPSSVG